mgnify:CR=1 FL=1
MLLIYVIISVNVLDTYSEIREEYNRVFNWKYHAISIIYISVILNVLDTYKISRRNGDIIKLQRYAFKS